MKILFVCLGNICRSPLAEALAIHKINEKCKTEGIENTHTIHSCGTANYHIGEQPDQRTINNARKNGITITHVGRQLNEHDLEEYDLILAMDKSNYQNIMRLKNASRYADKIKMMRDYDPNSPGADVPDPWSGDEKDFQNVFEILERSTAALVENISR